MCGLHATENVVSASRGLLPRAMSGSVALPQPQFMSMALVTNEGCEDAWVGLPM